MLVNGKVTGIIRGLRLTVMMKLEKKKVGLQSEDETKGRKRRFMECAREWWRVPQSV